MTGIYALNHSTLDGRLAALFGVAGYLLRARGFEPAPLLLGFVLSQLLQDNFNRALVFSNGDIRTFVTHPLSALLLTIAGGALPVTALPTDRRGRMRVRAGGAMTTNRRRRPGARLDSPFLDVQIAIGQAHSRTDNRPVIGELEERST